MAQFKKTITVEAEQWTGIPDSPSLAACIALAPGRVGLCQPLRDESLRSLYVIGDQSDQWENANPSDWLVKHNGRVRVVKAADFVKEYEPA